MKKCGIAVSHELDRRLKIVAADHSATHLLSQLFFFLHRLVELLNAKYTPKSDWQLVKVHMLTHYAASIRHGGCIREYNANLFEKSHTWTMKNPYRSTNKQKWSIVEQINRHHDQQEALRQTNLLRILLPAKRRKRTSLMEVHGLK